MSKRKTNDYSHWWQRVVVKTIYEREAMDDFYKRAYSERTLKDRAEARAHHPETNSTLGCGSVGDRFWCAVCRSPWPCRFLRYLADIHGSDVDPHWRDGRPVNVEQEDPS